MEASSFAFQLIEGPMRWLFLLHIAGGALALGVLILPLVSKKGGKLHVRAGWVYSAAMIAVGLSALVITPWRGFAEGSSLASRSFALFLFFIALLTLSSLSYGLLALRHKKRSAPLKGLGQLGPPALLALASVAVEAVGLLTGQTILMIFPVLGLFTAYEQARYWLHAPAERMHWWYAHMNGMGTASIATITAFLVTAVPRMTTAELFHSPLLWVGPGVVFGTALNRWAASYRARFETAGRPTSP